MARGKQTMRLDRTDNETGKGKYALIKMREIDGHPQTPQELAEAIMANPECVDFGASGSDSEFFVIRLKDKYAAPALRAYASAADRDDEEWGEAVYWLAMKAAQHPGQKQPD